MKLVLNSDVKFILDTLNNNGEGYIVGGAVRDMILGNCPKDYDFTTNIQYSNLKTLFRDFYPKEIGKHFGILMIKVNNKTYEIARYREDIGILNSRHPETVQFLTDINEDLKRRDFTINAMAYNENDGLIDIYEGIKDIKNRLIRFIGDPELRIKEDSLRILRAVRFAVKYNFTLETATKNSIYNNRNSLKKISKERIRDEFSKILLENNVDYGLYLMKELKLLEIIIPEIKDLYDFNSLSLCHSKDVFSHTVTVVKNTKSDLVTRIAALFHDIGKPNTHTYDKNGISNYYGHEKNSAGIAHIALKRLKFSNVFIREVESIIRNHMILFTDPNQKDIKKFICAVGIENLEKMYDLFQADIGANSSEKDYEAFKVLKKKIDLIIENNENIQKKDVEINGNDIMALKIPQRKIGKIKDEIYEKILDSKLNNNRLDIIDYIIKTQDITEEIKREKSSGAVIYRIDGQEIKFLLVMLVKGNWGFPKGHSETNETERETAAREVFEETGLNPAFHENFKETVYYFPAPFVLKTVVYFLAATKEKNVKIQDEEIAEYMWLNYEEASKLLIYKFQKDILKKANLLIQEKTSIADKTKMDEKEIKAGNQDIRGEEL